MTKRAVADANGQSAAGAGRLDVSLDCRVTTKQGVCFMVVYVSGQWLDDTAAAVSFQDRAVQFADAVYEVVPVYNGRFFKVDAHLDRLQHGLDTLRIACRATHL